MRVFHCWTSHPFRRSSSTFWAACITASFAASSARCRSLYIKHNAGYPIGLESAEDCCWISDILPRSLETSNLSSSAPLPAGPELGVDILYDRGREGASVFVYPWRRESPAGNSLFKHMFIISEKTREEQRSEKQCKRKPDQLAQNLLPCERPNSIPRTILLATHIPLSQRSTMKEQLA